MNTDTTQTHTGGEGNYALAKRTWLNAGRLVTSQTDAEWMLFCRETRITGGKRRAICSPDTVRRGEELDVILLGLSELVFLPEPQQRGLDNILKVLRRLDVEGRAA